MKRISRWARLFVVILGMMALAGCDRKTRLVIFMPDETGSAVAQWTPTKNKMVSTVRQCGPGDRIVCVGIDDKAYDPDDIRFDVTLPGNALLCQRAKKQLIEQIKALAARENSSGHIMPDGRPRGLPLGTDVLGTLDSVSMLCENSGDRQVYLVLCSDLADEPRLDTRRRHEVPFPKNALFTALFVSAKQGGNEYETRRGNWIAAFHSMGLPCDESNFHIIEQSAVAGIF